MSKPPLTSPDPRSNTVTYVVLAGSGDAQQRLTVSKRVLEKSPVIRDWIEDPSTIAPSLVKDGALNLADCDPEVVTTVIAWLRTSDNLSAARRLQDALDIASPASSSPDAIFFVKMYKLGLCLA